MERRRHKTGHVADDSATYGRHPAVAPQAKLDHLVLQARHRLARLGRFSGRERNALGLGAGGAQRLGERLGVQGRDVGVAYEHPARRGKVLHQMGRRTLRNINSDDYLVAAVGAGRELHLDKFHGGILRPFDGLDASTGSAAERRPSVPRMAVRGTPPKFFSTLLGDIQDAGGAAT